MTARPSASRLFATFILLFLTAALGYAVYFVSIPVSQADREAREYRTLFLVALGVIGILGSIYALTQRASRGERRWGDAINWLALLLPCYAAFQLVPLPLGLLRLLSPARAELVDALAPLGLKPDYAPLSVAPSATVNHALLLIGYVIVFLVIRTITRSHPETPWLPAIPILAVATWQALWGISQALGGGPEPFAHGTYPVRNHFAGFLEMSLPLALGFGVAIFNKRDPQGDLSGSSALGAGVGFIASVLMFAGVAYSLSRMGLVSCVGSLALVGTMALTPRLDRKRRLAFVSILCVAVIGGVLALAPLQLLARFSEQSADGRLDVWKDTLHLIAAYPIFGSGLGGYEFVFDRFKTSGFTLVQDYAHNDYLQFLAELGLVGFGIGVALVVLLLSRVFRATAPRRDVSVRWLALGCTGSLMAIMIHSLADFNLYVPANAMLLAWIGGIAGALPRPRSGMDDTRPN